ncbi:MAG TPA: ECF-type sigma factor [Bryobacteraceae bacterium]|nr:ECF-type sigma factor [Bryobacteraceae bacterium]
MLRPDEPVGSSSRNGGNEEALEGWVTALYTELRRLAAHYMERERGDHTLQTTALVHEAYLRLLEQREVQWESRSQVIGIAAQLMRRILLDYSRGRRSAKRGGKVRKIYLQEASLVSKDRTADVLAVDEALTRLAAVDPQHARVVELRFFGGLSVEETAGVLGVSPATVKRHWTVAKAWLARELKSG